jgi:hypothetical protein
MDEETDVIENLIINSPEEDASYTGVGKSIAVIILVVCVAAAIAGWILR